MDYLLLGTVIFIGTFIARLVYDLIKKKISD